MADEKIPKIFLDSRIRRIAMNLIVHSEYSFRIDPFSSTEEDNDILAALKAMSVAHELETMGYAVGFRFWEMLETDE